MVSIVPHSAQPFDGAAACRADQPGTVSGFMSILTMQKSHALAGTTDPLDAAMRRCLKLVSELLASADTESFTALLSEAATRWAEQDLPLDVLLHRVNESLRDCLGRPANRSTLDTVRITAQHVVAVSRVTSAIVSRAYVREVKAAVAHRHTTVQTFTSGLLAGIPTETSVQAAGIAVQETYTVLALAIPPHPDESNPSLDASVVARRKLRRTQSALATWPREGRALSLLSIDGGTVLVPGYAGTAELKDLLATLSRAAQTPITAAVSVTAAADIPESVDRTHSILDIVHRLGYTPGLNHFGDFALEYQLTRPGPGRETLGSLLRPLDEQRKLLETLYEHIKHNADRRRASAAMRIHPNTLDYRLKRIKELTGLDPCHPAGFWHLRSALIARAFGTACDQPSDEQPDHRTGSERDRTGDRREAVSEG